MIVFLDSITDMIINIFGFCLNEPMIVLLALCLVIYTFGSIKWLF